MHLTTQKQPLKEYRYLETEERFALYKYALNIVYGCVFVALLMIMPELDTAFSWIKG